MTTSGPNSPGTMADDATVGTVAWSNPDNAKVSDDVYATVEGRDSSFLTHYLKATNFGFSIPTGATINGITVEVEAKTDTTNTALRSYTYAKIVKGGTIGTYNDNHTPAAGYYPTLDAYTSFPETVTNDLFGTTWTAEDINNSGFGVATIVFVLAGLTAGKFVSIDHIRITVYYTEGIINYVRSLSDTIKLIESLTKQSTLSKSDILRLTESLNRNIEYTRTLTENEKIMEILYGNFGLSESDKIYEFDSKILGTGFSRTENMKLLESESSQVYMPKTENEKIMEILYGNFGLTKSDILKLTEDINYYSVINFIESLLDKIRLTEDKTMQIGFSMQDKIKLIENIDYVNTFLKSLTDYLRIYEDKIINFSTLKQDILGVSDSKSINLNLSKFEILKLTDSLINQFNLSKSDVLKIIDTLNRNIEYNRTLTDNEQLIDSLSNQFGLSKFDILRIIDSFSKSTNLTLTQLDNLRITESFAKSSVIQLTESISLTDTLNLYRIFLETLSDNMGLSDSYSKSLTLTKQDLIGLRDDYIKSLGFSLTDNLKISELLELITTFQFERSFSDSFGLSDLFSYIMVQQSPDVRHLINLIIKDKRLNITIDDIRKILMLKDMQQIISVLDKTIELKLGDKKKDLII